LDSASPTVYFARHESDNTTCSSSLSLGTTTADGFAAVGGNPDFGSPWGGVLPTSPVLAAWSALGRVTALP